ncbi:cytidyltransferase-like protein [Peptoclostridium acidaminophilum DSM 3953]|uniref:nicotinate-nucleotide adenylyltransferase n=1 Tax=Peptoclostridium acidaminophilum DSM 3953 TaxID=1286171 RepID=W8TKT0_PEPAC|nr:cytidyltransferase [Peptoclostridium acidaminophilum]AHM56812.1 cytidyltransferase-like protein [Peptoclostridium acidaminophilum DSM 3953]
MQRAQKGVTDEILHNIKVHLGDERFLRRGILLHVPKEEFPIKSKLICDFLSGEAFEKGARKMIEKKDFSCKRALEIIRPLMDEMARGKEPEDWLKYAYQYLLSKSFPESVEMILSKDIEGPTLLYLEFCRLINEEQKKTDDGTWQSRYPFEFLTDAEVRELEDFGEYERLKEALGKEYIYELMKLNQEITEYNNLDHICGVHFLALFIGRQFKSAGIPVDLGRVSGAGLGHDIGKYGCKTAELKRVPYLHYYYTDQWFKRHDISYIGNVALNHSVWDLEPENLSLESLILIYSDFRVKNNSDGDMHIYSLKESFDVILDKLDNVDDAKRKRYLKVYNKIKDFEDFMIDIGIQVIPTKGEVAYSVPQKKYYALMSGGDVVENFKYLAVSHNINLMHRLRNELSLNQIIELARSERDWNNLRKYLEIFEEYSTYLTQRQKYITMRFLYEKLIHPEDDIRRRCSEIIGKLIANFDEEYRKDVPDDVELSPPEMTGFQVLDKFMKLFLYPDHNIIRIHQQWIGEALSMMLQAVFRNSKAKSTGGFVEVLAAYYQKGGGYSDSMHLHLLGSLQFIPFSAQMAHSGVFLKYLEDTTSSSEQTVRLLAYEVLGDMEKCGKFREEYLEQMLVNLLEKERLLEDKYEKWAIRKLIRGLKKGEIAFESLELEQTEISEIFLSNFKNTTSWVIKRSNIELLLEYSLTNLQSYGLYTALHFCNLLKVSPNESTRLKSGEALLKMFPLLPQEQGYDVAIELFRSLEIEEYQFTKYIPHYLGQILMYLSPENMESITDDLSEKMKRSGARVNSLLLRTIGVCIANYAKYKVHFDEKSEKYEKRFTKKLGILLSGLAHNDNQVKQMAFSVIGSEIFGNPDIELEHKSDIFALIAKKILTLIAAEKQEELTFLNNSAVLNNIYRFISDYMFLNGEIQLKAPEKIAFFPGTFDPFSLSHREIARAIRKKGFEVYLAVDEFSWSKSTQPNMIRRNIINMSIADELSVYIYPEDFPVNLTNAKDLKVLRQNFKRQDVYIVVGSDVVLNATAYRAPVTENSIQTFPHVVFERRSHFETEDTDKVLDKALENIKAPIIKLFLPPRYEDVSSTRIRNYIDENRDISKLVDPMVQRYIYDNGLYRREPSYKSLIQKLQFDIEIVSDIRDSLIETLALNFHHEEYNSALERLQEFSEKPLASILIVKDNQKNNKIIGYSAFHWLASSQIFNEFKDSLISESIREQYTGRIILVSGIFIDRNCGIENLNQIILTETLSHCISRDYGYAVYINNIDMEQDEELYETLQLQGFIKQRGTHEKRGVFAVNMSRPCSLYLDIRNIMKFPFRDNPAVVRQINIARKRLQKALAELYPGNLVLSFDRRVMEETLMKKICRENGVPTTPLNPRRLGDSMCVPFGNVLNRLTIPNTVTKALHTEKIFERDMSSFRIEQFPHYLNLENQIKMIKSFKRPVILIDDILNKGYRIKVLDPLLKKEDVQVKKIIVGMLSGRGKELMDIQGRAVDSAYFIPNLRIWFTEQLLYPFMGGDALWREYSPKSNIIPSLNMVLPYAYPSFIRGASRESIFELSKICLENSMDILRVLESEYENINERNLTLGLLGEVFLYPRCPEMGKDVRYDLNMNPSSFLEDQLEYLKRLEAGFK